MSNNPFGLNNWLGHDGDGGTATKDVFQIGRNNRIHSPDDTNKRSNTDLGATIIDVRTSQNAALIGNNACITDPCVGVYGHCDGLVLVSQAHATRAAAAGSQSRTTYLCPRCRPVSLG